DGVQRGKPWVAHTMKEHQLPTMVKEGVQIDPSRGGGECFGRFGSGGRCPRVDVHSRSREGRSDRIESAVKKTRDPLCRCDASVEQETGIDLTTLRVLWPCESLLERGSLFGREAAVAPDASS